MMEMKRRRKEERMKNKVGMGKEMGKRIND